MASQLDYVLAREQQAALGRRAERVRQRRAGMPVKEGARGGRLLRRLLAGSQQRELPLAPRGVESAPVATGCLELE